MRTRRVAVAVLLAAVSLAGASDYAVYRVALKTAYDFERADPDSWQRLSGTGSALALLDASGGPGNPVLNGMAVVNFWSEGGGRYYDVETFMTGVFFHVFGNGTGALVMAQPWWLGEEPPKEDVSVGVSLGVFLGKLSDGPPKALKGTHLTVAPDLELSRFEAAFKLDAKLSAAAAAAAAANPGDPFGAALGVLVQAVEAMGYTPEP